ncbi:hypothetical protein Tco_1026502 [Tanacetum coccineum]
MIVVKKVVVEYFLDSSNFGSRIVVVDDTPIVIDKLDRVTIAFQKEDTVRKNLSFVTSGYLAFGRHLEEIHVTWAHLEKKRTRLRTYTNISQEFYSEAGDGVTDYT